MKYKRITVEQYEEYLRLKAADDHRTAKIRESFRIKSQCNVCGYQSMDRLPGNACPMDRCWGGMRSFDG